MRQTRAWGLWVVGAMASPLMHDRSSLRRACSPARRRDGDLGPVGDDILWSPSSKAHMYVKERLLQAAPPPLVFPSVPGSLPWRRQLWNRRHYRRRARTRLSPWVYRSIALDSLSYLEPGGVPNTCVGEAFLPTEFDLILSRQLPKSLVENVI